MDFESVQLLCDMVKYFETGLEKPTDQIHSPSNLVTCLQSISAIFQKYGSDLHNVHANFALISDRATTFEIIRIIRSNCVGLQTFKLTGSLVFPTSCNCLPDLTALRSLALNNFTREFDDSIVEGYLKRTTKQLKSLSLQNMWLDGSCLKKAPSSVQSLTLRSLNSLSMINIIEFLVNCDQLTHFDLEMAGGVTNYKFFILLARCLRSVKTLKIKINNCSRWMDTLCVVPIASMEQLESLELEIDKTTEVNRLLVELAQRDQIYRLAITLNEYLAPATINALALFSTLNSLKVNVPGQNKFNQLVEIFSQITAQTTITTLELTVSSLDVEPISRFFSAVRHLNIRADGHLKNIFWLSSMPLVETITLMMELHQDFFEGLQDVDLLDMLDCTLQRYGIIELEIIMLSNTEIDEPTMSSFRQLAAQMDANIKLVDADWYAVGRITSGVRFRIDTKKDMLITRVKSLLNGLYWRFLDGGFLRVYLVRGCSY